MQIQLSQQLSLKEPGKKKMGGRSSHADEGQDWTSLRAFFNPCHFFLRKKDLSQSPASILRSEGRKKSREERREEGKDRGGRRNKKNHLLHAQWRKSNSLLATLKIKSRIALRKRNLLE
jgi:hypothetical protein